MPSDTSAENPAWKWGGGGDGDKGEAANLANGHEKYKYEEKAKTEKDKKKYSGFSNAFELTLGILWQRYYYSPIRWHH